MNEQQLWQKLRPKLNEHGLAARIENAAATSLPDVIFVAEGVTTFLELKIVKSHKIIMVPFQYAFGIKLRLMLDPDQFWIIADYNDKLIGIKYTDITEFAMANKKIVEFDVRKVKYIEISNLDTWCVNLENGGYK